jgi:hypothetical protein
MKETVKQDQSSTCCNWYEFYWTTDQLIFLHLFITVDIRSSYFYFSFYFIILRFFLFYKPIQT